MLTMSIHFLLRAAGHILPFVIFFVMTITAYMRYERTDGRVGTAKRKKNDNWTTYAAAALFALIIAAASFSTPSHFLLRVIAGILAAAALIIVIVPMHAMSWKRIKNGPFVVACIGSLTLALTAIALSFWEYSYPQVDHPSIRGGLGVVLVQMMVFVALGLFHGARMAKSAMRSSVVETRGEESR
jgi:Na+/proline symporter